MTRAALLLALLLGCLPAAATAQEIGRLFLTPDQRAALDARRKARIPDKPAAAVETSFARLDGYVRRSSGPATVFVNGDALPVGAPVEGLRIVPNRGDPSRVGVSVGEDGKPVELKVGQTLERITGEVSDVIGGGEIRVAPRAASKARR